jgi:hypothetical protein
MASPEAWLCGAIQNAAGCGAYPVAIPEGVAPPFVRYMRAITSREPSLSGTASPIGSFAVEIYSDGYLACKELADHVRSAVNNFSGSASGATIEYVVLTDERDGDPVFFEGRDSPTYMIEQTYSIGWQE